MGAWIEIPFNMALACKPVLSHPTMGAWIEILFRNYCGTCIKVAPHDGCVD